MWFIHSCLSAGPCQPQTNGELAEWMAAAAVLFTALLGALWGFLAALEWLDGHL